jgi:hypothetical protein
MAGIEFPIERIYSQTVSGQPKSEVLQMLQDRHPGCSYHFVEDKMGTLSKVSIQEANLHFIQYASPFELAVGVWGGHADGTTHAWPHNLVYIQVQKLDNLTAWQLYLVDWGYNTVAERQEAKDSPRIELIGMERFRELVAAAAAQ